MAKPDSHDAGCALIILAILGGIALIILACGFGEYLANVGKQ